MIVHYAKSGAGILCCKMLVYKNILSNDGCFLLMCTIIMGVFSFLKSNSCFMIRKVRVILAVVAFICVTLLFLDFSGVMHHWLGWIAKMQFVPAVLAGNFAIVAMVLCVTLLFGRFYCSILCPLGVMQDGFNFIARKVKKNRFHFVKENRWLRYPLLVVFVVLLVAGLASIAALIEPYSAFGRIANNLLQPVWLWINNILAGIAERRGSYAFYEADVWMKSGVSLAVAAVTLVVVGFLALRRGRTWCSTVCPVGTFLGLFSRFSLFRPVIDADKCKNCHQCEKNCKASCIDIENHRIDYSRCVACMDCIEECKFEALEFGRKRKAENGKRKAESGERRTEGEKGFDDSRRKFVVTSALVAGAAAVKAQQKKFDGGLAVVEEKKIPHRDVPLKPAGALSLKNFDKHCTACQLCVTECPNGVLRPSGKLERLMQPEMSFERGFCRPECTRCGDVCPTGAIHSVTKEQKTDIHIGYAVVVPDNCLAYRDGVSCGNCARHCPSEAILMVERDGSEVKVPAVNTDKCIGCGACEYLCPSRPFSAIYVNGRERHC